MSVDIRPVTKDNWRELIKLKVRDDQKNFVVTNEHSIAESQFGYDDPEYGHWDMYPFGIYDNQLPVGFLMYGFNFSQPNSQAFIIRLMVDESQQGKGYGRSAMKWMIKHFRADDRIQAVGISYEPENEVARKLYADLGFVETGEMSFGEVVAVLQLK